MVRADAGLRDAAHEDLVRSHGDYLEARRVLVGAMASASRSGVAANRITRDVEGLFGRCTVIEFCRAVRVFDAASRALARAGLSAWVEMPEPGIDAPREVRLRLCSAQQLGAVPGRAQLPDRIGRALGAAGLVIEAPGGGEAGAGLLDGESVRVLGRDARDGQEG